MRTIEQIHEEYGKLCAQAGHTQYQITQLQLNLDHLNKQLRDLNLEADALNKTEKGE